MKQSYSEHLHVYERTEGNTYCGCSAWPDSYYHCCVMLVEFVDRAPALELTRHLVWVQQLERRLNRFSWSAVFERLTECYEEVTLSQSQTVFFFLRLRAATHTGRGSPEIEVYLQLPTFQNRGPEGFFHEFHSRKTSPSFQYSLSDCCCNHAYFPLKCIHLRAV